MMKCNFQDDGNDSDCDSVSSAEDEGMSSNEEIESESEGEGEESEQADEKEEGDVDGAIDAISQAQNVSTELDRETTMSDTKSATVMSAKEQAAQRKELATTVSISKILTDEDFKKIETAQMNKQITSAKRKRVTETESKYVRFEF